jgi:methionyl aminopeptidase
MLRTNKKRRIVLKSKQEIELMRRAGTIAAKALAEIGKYVRPGVTTGEMNDIANEELVHGIPSYKKVLYEGDIFSIDCGAYYKGWVGDVATTIPVGKVSDEAQHLLEVTEQALYIGIAQGKLGSHTEDISATIQEFVEGYGYNVVRQYTGHGVGQNMHEDPQVPNFGKRGKGARLKKGMTIALEPMVNVGTWATKLLDDGWTVVTADGKLAAHFEHSFVVTDGEPDILTLL